ncbi:MAG: PepSY domain-containing protein [Gemmatimonadaceae bacterium]
MTKFLLAAAFVAAIAAPAAAQSAAVSGNVQPSKAARVDVKVNQSLASSAKISGDSAFALARAHADNGEVSSAELENSGGRLVYEVHVLNKSKRASTVTIDAMTGEVVEAKQHGGLKSTTMHHKENKKLLDAKRDSAAKTP